MVNYCNSDKNLLLQIFLGWPEGGHQPSMLNWAVQPRVLDATTLGLVRRTTLMGAVATMKMHL